MESKGKPEAKIVPESIDSLYAPHLLVQAIIHNFVDGKQDDHYTGCHLNRHGNDGLLEKDPRRNHPEENKKKRNPMPYLLLGGK